MSHGRTGHWINHSQEHCLVGKKGLAKSASYEDCDIIVAEPTDSSRKPEELYQVIERMVPNGKKLEIFGRRHNLRAGWTTLGNQL
ncbi:MT-A70 family protein [Thraustotheca clavata]|uniref:mRNA m(6)A methyltransferase n=1 Tax=Thraustotheca clavata TaxID=74557 RepID=A0A1V9ZC99_9STRA|nr:MT-A70 family protein [Thraustotheca clavata]